MAVTEMPICGGIVQFQPQSRPGWKANQLEVRIPKDICSNGDFPLDFMDLTSQLAYVDIQAAGFPVEEIDTKLLMTKSFNIDLAAGIEATAAQANFVKGGCLLGLAMWHNVVDAHGAYNFARLWASHCKKLQTEPGWESQWKSRLTMETVAANKNRQLLTELWRKEGGGKKSLSDRQWRILGIHSPAATDAPRLDQVLAGAAGGNKEMKKVRTCIFSVSNMSLEQLRRDAMAGDTKVTTDDTLHALLWRSIMRARYPSPTDEASDYQIALDGRQKLGRDPLEAYLGDAFFFATATLPLTTVTAPTTSVGQLAETLRTMLDSISRTDLLAAFGAAHDLPSYANLPYSLAGIIGPSMIVVSHQYISLPKLNFGPALNSPDCERSPGDEWNEFFRRTIIMPTASGAGLEILIELFDDEMNRLHADNEFTRYAKFASH